jgi:type IV pilus assembly protein PilC
MPAFQYKAIDQNGRFHNGQVEAVNIADLESRLTKMDMDLVNFRELKAKGSGITGQGVQRRDLIMFCFHMEQTARAGVPILESLQDLRDSMENPRMREVLAAMMDSVEGGMTLSQAMRNYPAVFNEVFCNLVRAGEQSGEMAQVFGNLNENLKWQDEQASYTKKLLMYPLFVGTVVLAVVFFLMTYLVPELLIFIQTMGEELPVHTRVLISVSGVFTEYWYIMLGLPVAAAVAIAVAVKVSPEARYNYDAFKLRIPVIGPITHKIIMTRMANFFAMMYGAGITIIECIRTSEEIAGNKVVEETMRRVGQRIADGASLSDSFASTGMFPPLVLRMIRVGENTGALEEALKNVSYFYTRDVRESIEKLQAMIEPAMTIILGGIIAWVMFSVLGPIYDLITKVDI